MAGTPVTGDLYHTIDGRVLEIKRQLRQAGGYPFDPRLLNDELQRLVEGHFVGQAFHSPHLIGIHPITVDYSKLWDPADVWPVLSDIYQYFLGPEYPVHESFPIPAGAESTAQTRVPVFILGFGRALKLREALMQIANLGLQPCMVQEMRDFILTAPPRQLYHGMSILFLGTTFWLEPRFPRSVAVLGQGTANPRMSSLYAANVQTTPDKTFGAGCLFAARPIVASRA